MYVLYDIGIHYKYTESIFYFAPTQLYSIFRYNIIGIPAHTLTATIIDRVYIRAFQRF